MLMAGFDEPVTVQQAVATQLDLRRRVVVEDDFGTVHTVAGLDVAYDRAGAATNVAAAVLRLADLSLVETAVASASVTFPYVPGLLAFRELPALLVALEQLRQPPDLRLCDGHGLAHPRRFGLACHLGVITNIPSIGVAKRRLIGQHEPVGDQRGAWQPLRDGDELVGAALRTQTDVRPIYVSVGHRVSLATAIDLVLRCTPRYRRPEPLRQAHRLAKG